MIADLAAAMPGNLAGFAPRMRVGAVPGCVAACEIARGRAAYVALAEPFRRRFPRADERALLSFWTQYYFSALIVPALAAAARLDTVLPLALEEVALEPDAEGTIACFRLAHGGKRCGGSAVEATLDVLVASHLRPFIDGCAAWSGLSPRVLWCNAGVMLDWAAQELCLALPPCAGLTATEAPLLAPFRQPREDLSAAGCAGCPRKRRTCCLRLRLAGIPCCGASCPLEV